MSGPYRTQAEREALLETPVRVPVAMLVTMALVFVLCLVGAVYGLRSLEDVVPPLKSPACHGRVN